jgi:hypothetical protein
MFIGDNRQTMNANRVHVPSVETLIVRVEVTIVKFLLAKITGDTDKLVS